MPVSFTDLRDEELAEALAISLSDFEFELLVRNRIKRTFGHALETNQNFDESNCYCTFQYRWSDKCEWDVALGGSYRDRVSVKGEVLSISVDDCHAMWNRQHKNKLSLLLPGS